MTPSTADPGRTQMSATPTESAPTQYALTHEQREFAHQIRRLVAKVRSTTAAPTSPLGATVSPAGRHSPQI